MRYVMWLIQQVGFWISFAYLLTLSTINGIKSRSHPPVLRFENSYAGQKILLVALYEKGMPRPDIQMLMKSAKEQGAYVLAVNTLRFTEASAWQGLIDCYIEKHNFGRDFSSYQAGFLHLYSRGWEKTCPRVLMLNDSVFYCSRRTPQFVADLFDFRSRRSGRPRTSRSSIMSARSAWRWRDGSSPMTGCGATGTPTATPTCGRW